MWNIWQVWCLMYADDIILLSDSPFGMQKSVWLLEKIVKKKWYLSTNTRKNSYYSIRDSQIEMISH